MLSRYISIVDDEIYAERLKGICRRQRGSKASAKATTESPPPILFKGGGVCTCVCVCVCVFRVGDGIKELLIRSFSVFTGFRESEIRRISRSAPETHENTSSKLIISIIC